MAYFSGGTTARPWPKVDPKIVVVGVILLALVAAIAYAAASMTKQTEEKAAPLAAGATEAQILVAKYDIAPGKRLFPSMFKLETRSVVGIEKMVVTGYPTINKKFSTGVIEAGSPLFVNQFSAVKPAVAFTSRIPAGHRAVSIRVNAESAVEGWAKPGSKVDVVWSTQHRGRQIVTVIVQNAEIISAGSSTEGTSSEKHAQLTGTEGVPSHVTLLVSSSDAQKIQAAKTSGTLSMNLRGDGDSEELGRSGTVTVNTLLKQSGLIPFDDVEARIKLGGQEFFLSGGELHPAQKSHFKGIYDSGLRQAAKGGR